VQAKPEIGLHSGVIFVLRNINDGVNINQQNRLHPYYLVYLSKNELDKAENYFLEAIKLKLDFNKYLQI
jgi:hypothetical protein